MNKSIVVENVYKSYKSQSVLSGITFEASENSVVGLVGSNGSGKTTLIKIISGLVRADKGHITVDGVTDYRHFGNEVSVLLADNRNLYWKLTVKENINFILSLRKNKTKETIALTNKLLKEFNMEDKENTVVQELSRGMQQKLSIILTIVDTAKIIMLDEPTLGLDNESCLDLVKFINNMKEAYNKVFIISSHDFQFLAKICDRVLYLSNGTIKKDFITDSISNILNFNQLQVCIQKSEDTDLKCFFSKFEEHLGKVSLDDDGLIINFKINDTSQIKDIIDSIVSEEIILRSINYSKPKFEFIVDELNKLV
ncbi:ABC transporter ATP-binding protein [Inconstantimicrobium porci]|uniref:ABC transporter ATP-binding protein n=1 Tax=Inconstantimicrobium porci TaxID=2652291 RepID=UPI0012B387E0|nr:ABC transporter ATP-binding protein [Inconstantimicrobium porci]